MINKFAKSIIGAFLSGLVIGLVYWLFTKSAEKLQHLIWIDVGQTEEHRWTAIVIGAIGAVILSWLLNYLKIRGHQDIGHKIEDYIKFKGITVKWVLEVLIIGLASLVLGASLGPEAVLIPVSYGIAFLFAKAFKIVDAPVFGILGLIALLASFFNTFFVGLVILGAILAQKNKTIKQISLTLVAASFSAGGALLTLFLIREKEGYVSAQLNFKTDLKPEYLALALIVSFMSFFVPYLLTKSIQYAKPIFDKIRSLHWFGQGLSAGLVLGLLYALMGPVGYFSGHEGIEDILLHSGSYGSMQLLTLVLLKLLATAWSIGTIYKGGTIFPLLLVALSFIIGINGGGIEFGVPIATALVAVFFGVFSGSLGSGFISAAFVLSVFGLSVWPIVVMAAIGAFLAQKLIAKSNQSRAVA